ncbi:MAG: HipA domain-containing protein [Polyangiaceae bacterium]|nr:HipA domain-containing protein [Polyangiaceae bacterium]
MSANPFPVYELPVDVVRDDLEPLGTKRKFWYRNDAGEKWLFKYGRPGTGEHWAEKIASEIAGCLGLPCAEVELARHGEDWGTISRDFTNDGSYALVHGNELLGEQLPDYPTGRRYRVRQHTLDAIRGVLSTTTIEAPAGLPVELPEPRAFALFVGYLLLDAVIGNTDRHHENWGVLLLGTNPRRMTLAPTFDHASSLGRELADDKRLGRLAAKDDERGIVGYAEGARVRSAIYRAEGDGSPMSPLEALSACRELASDAFDRWIDHLAAVQASLVRWRERVEVRVMSEAAAEFAGRLVRHNVARVLRCRS